jgi:hypothetical protein
MTTEPEWLREAHARGEYGNRVTLARAGRAVRLAMDRAEAAEPRLSALEYAVFMRVIRHTETYTKIVDEVSFDQLVPAGAHPKSVSRALRRLAARGIIHYQAGRGRPSKTSNGWRPTVVGLPESGEEKVTASGSLSDDGKGNQADIEKVTATRARTRARSFLGPEKETEEKAASSAPARGDDDHEPYAFTSLMEALDEYGGLRGAGRKLALKEWHRDSGRLMALVTDACARGEDPPALFVRMLQDGDPVVRDTDGRIVVRSRRPRPDCGVTGAELDAMIGLLRQEERGEEEPVNEEAAAEIVAEEWADAAVPEEPAVADSEPTMIAKPDESTADAVVGLSRAVDVAESPWLQESVARLADAARRRGEREDSELGARDAA